MNPHPTTQILLYLPVLHAGYEDFLHKWARRGAVEILLAGWSITRAYPQLAKEVRALAPQRAAEYLNGANGLPSVRVVESDTLKDAVGQERLVLPAEEVSRNIVRDFHLESQSKITFDSTFLRWDRKWSRRGRPVGFQGRTTADETAVLLSSLAIDTGLKSSDWWRQVGAVAVSDGQVVGSAHNRHLPTEYSPYFNSDPRNAFSRGREIEAATAIHAEASLIAQCARNGMKLEGCDLFVSTFPCPNCARLISDAGFRRVFFSSGYSLLEGEEVLRRADVELVFVDMEGAAAARQTSLEDLVGQQILGDLAEEASSEHSFRRHAVHGAPHGPARRF